MSTLRKFSDNRPWRKSSRSGDNAGTCLYAATTDDQVGIRDSKQGNHGPQLWLLKSEWSGVLSLLNRC